MTNKEAAEILKLYKQRLDESCSNLLDKDKGAFDLAIKALDNKDLISRSDLIRWIDDSVSQYGHTYSIDMLNMWGLFKDYLINKAPAGGGRE